MRIISLEKKKELSCDGKRKYDTSKEAKKYYDCHLAIKTEEFSQYLFRDIINIYECSFCKKWHIGHAKNGGYIIK